jgi:predicted Zn-dependent protease
MIFFKKPVPTFRDHAANRKEANAFALAGGDIYIFEGLGRIGRKFG